ncbi:ankyrin repeat domain-containing protein [Spiroplasma endosymbiont of Nomada ruficornis]|uniref:ankyrin repeat domain-containing protein n=1 Tax=Spiroplasma endosymbiont of Nomada ruficornis TaxID=3066325 RepID=UPI00313C0F86
MLNINNEKVLFDSKFIGVKIKNGFIYVEEPWCNNQGVAILPYVLKDNQYYYLQIHKEKNPAHEIVSKISQYSTITGGLESMDYYTTVVKEMWEEVGIDISGNNVLINRFNHSFSNKSSNKKWFLYAINLTNLNLDINKIYYGKGGDGTNFEKGIHGKFVTNESLINSNDLLSISIKGKTTIKKEINDFHFNNFKNKIQNINESILWNKEQKLKNFFEHKNINDCLIKNNEKNEKYNKNEPLVFLLHYAVDNGYFEIVEYLLQHGAYVNLKDINGCTPLQIAVANSDNDIEIVKLLIENGADINAQDENNCTILDYAFNNNRIEIIKEILKYDNINDINKKKYIDILLIYFSKYNDILSFRWLNENFKINANIEDKKSRYTPLQIAVKNNNIEMVKLLLENHADIDAQDVDGCTPLHLVVECNNIEMVKLLLENHADVNLKDINGCTPLHWAVECNNIEIVKLFIENGADINAQDETLATTLYLSIYTKNIEMVKLLLENGADPNIKDVGGFIPLDVVLKKYDISWEISELLFKQLNFVYVSDNPSDMKNIKRKFFENELINSTSSKLPKLIFEKNEINSIDLQNQPSTSWYKRSSSQM